MEALRQDKILIIHVTSLSELSQSSFPKDLNSIWRFHPACILCSPQNLRTSVSPRNTADTLCVFLLWNNNNVLVFHAMESMFC